jgi:parallel beta-helix repeat protein
MKRKWLAIGIILLFVGTCIIPAIAQDTNKALPSSRGDWLYVGGSGPGNYTKIQDAVDNSSNGDTVFVFNGTYFESLHVWKIILLCGQDRDSTIIDGSHSTENVISITSANVRIEGFTIRNSLDYSWGVFSNRDNVSILDNYIEHNSGAIYIRDCQNVTIKWNHITQNHRQAIDLYNVSNSTISWNFIYGHYTQYLGVGVNLFQSKNITITRNTILENYFGVSCTDSSYTTIYANKIESCEDTAIYFSNASWCNISSNNLSSYIDGVFFIFHSNYNSVFLNEIHASLRNDVDIASSFFNTVTHNNMEKKGNSASFFNSMFNRWDENFWGAPRLFPKPIVGHYYINSTIGIPWFQFDWHPAQEPYDIPGVN